MEVRMYIIHYLSQYQSPCIVHPQLPKVPDHLTFTAHYDASKVVIDHGAIKPSLHHTDLI
jgi:hypothetical protein